METTSEKKIFTALCEINKQVEPVGKNHKNKDQGFQYRSIDDVMNELHNLFAENRVIIIPEVLEHNRVEGKTKSGTTAHHTWLKIKFRLTAEDGSFVETTGIGEAIDTSDKGTNKAQAVALKYALTQMFLIPTNEQKDTDAETHETKAPEKKPAAPAPEPKKPAKPTLTDKAVIDACSRMKAGEIDLYDKIKNTYQLSQQQLIILSRTVDEILNHIEP